MSIFKPFITSDVIVSPFKVNKSFTFNGHANITGSGIDIFTGTNTTSSLWISGSDNTGYITSQSSQLIYRSIKELYYSNYLLSPVGSLAATASFNNDGTITGDAYTPNYYNYPSSTFLKTFNFDGEDGYLLSDSYTSTSIRFFPSSSNASIVVISIPSNLFGEYIKPGSFRMGFDINQQSPTYYFYDDSEGNIFYSEFAYNNIDGPVGNIIYEHGLIILTQPVNNDLTLFQIPFTNNVSCSFESTVTIHETQYKCTIRENEFNFSNNPSLISGSAAISNDSGSSFSQPGSGKLNDNVTGSYFSPYITTVGLYNNNKELLAVAKLAQPLPVSSVTDTSILINFDF
jgi:hypothetical protein